MSFLPVSAFSEFYFLTAYHNVYLCINSNFFLHSLTCTGMTDYSVHKTFMHLLSKFWPHSYIHTVLPTEVRQRHQMLSRRMKNMLLAPLTLAPCRWATHPRSKTTMATWWDRHPSQWKSNHEIPSISWLLRTQPDTEQSHLQSASLTTWTLPFISSLVHSFTPTPSRNRAQL